MERARNTSAAQPPVILVADADRNEARRLAEYLSQHGFRASHTSSGQDVLFRARSGGIGLAIVDVVLQDMSGHALASQLKEINPALPILMTSGDYRPELEIQSRQVGILYYAHKPADGRVLEAVVARALRRAGQA
jgi:DNA-binding response OmpR family regulator